MSDRASKRRKKNGTIEKTIFEARELNDTVVHCVELSEKLQKVLNRSELGHFAVFVSIQPIWIR